MRDSAPSAMASAESLQITLYLKLLLPLAITINSHADVYGHFAFITYVVTQIVHHYEHMEAKTQTGLSLSL